VENESDYRAAGGGQRLDAGEPPCAMLTKQRCISAIHDGGGLAERAASYQSGRTLLLSKQGCGARH
jgi:hypothetical protein